MCGLRLFDVSQVGDRPGTAAVAFRGAIGNRLQRDVDALESNERPEVRQRIAPNPKTDALVKERLDAASIHNKHYRP